MLRLIVVAKGQVLYFIVKIIADFIGDLVAETFSEKALPKGDCRAQQT